MVVDQVRVLDRADTRPQRPLDRPHRVGVRGDVAVGRLGLLDDRDELLDRVLGGVDPVGG